MATRMTVDQLKKLKTHDLAEMLTNVVLLLQRMPNVECGQLMELAPDSAPEEPVEAEQRSSTPLFTRAELTKKTVAELKILAKELNVFLAGSIRKDDLIQKILARPSDGRSEQRAIRDM